MTAKEKAKQLYDKMEFETKYNSQPSTVQGMCKKLALICVDEILEFAYDIEWEKKEEAISKLKFLKEVKQELNEIINKYEK